MIGRKYSIKINGVKWNYACLSDKEYEKRFGTDSAGLTNKHQNEMYFKKCEFKFSLIIHELVHVYSKLMCLSDTNDISVEDFEEIRATFNETNNVQIIQKAIHIYTRINPKDNVKLNKIQKSLDLLTRI